MLIPGGAQNIRLSLRPASVDDDDFIFRVYSSTRAAELAQVNWSPEQMSVFLHMQSAAQLQHYRLNNPASQVQIIEMDYARIGRLISDRSENPILLMDIALLPEYQNRGVGAALIRDLMTEAAGRNWSVRLHVEVFNPAIKLYQRLGFVITDQQGVYHEMLWRP